MVQDMLQKIDKFAIAPVRHLLGISDLHPSMNPDIDARAEVKSYVNMPAYIQLCWSRYYVTCLEYINLFFVFFLLLRS